MMDTVVVTMAICLSFITLSSGFKVPRLPTSQRIAPISHTAVYDAAVNPAGMRDLTGYSLWVKFTGFGVEDMNFGIELNDKFQAIYSRGLESAYPGFWRIIGYDDGREVLEVTQPVLPEYMLFFDLWEPTVLWRGKIDIANNKIVEGEVTTNKKRFGFFPYTETLATFEAELLTPGKKLPTVELPSFSDQRFQPPDDFDSPFDMKRYPQFFDPEFVEYFFQSEDMDCSAIDILESMVQGDYFLQFEDAIAKGEEPPIRPKKYFSPDSSQRMGDDGEITESEDMEVSGKNLKERSKPVTGMGAGKSFGKKK